jgi:hypothetical protein
MRHSDLLATSCLLLRGRSSRFRRQPFFPPFSRGSLLESGHASDSASTQVLSFPFAGWEGGGTSSTRTS